MKRRLWTVAAVSLLAGWAQAQSPATTPSTSKASKDAAQDAGVMVLRVPGQSDRKVKVIKATKLEDGRNVTEVKDIATGETIYVSNETAKQPKPATTTTTLASDIARKPTTLDKTISNSTEVSMPQVEMPKVPAPKVDLPKSKSRDYDPLLSTTTSRSPAAMASGTVTKTKPVVSEPASVKNVVTKPEAKPATKPSTPVMPTNVTPPAVMPKALPSMPASVTLPSPTVTPKPLPATIAVPAPMPMPATMPKNAVGVAGQPVQVNLPVGVVPFEFRMKEETSPYIATLQSAMRPTQRQDAATCLAEGRYASTSEVKSILATSAKADPAPVVRAHCIDCLSNLGYNDVNHVAYLRQCTIDSEDCVKTAAANALVKLMPKK